MKVYTKTGDAGNTSLYGGKRVRKDNIRIDAYGTVDELNAIIGMIKAEKIEKKTSDILNNVQQVLFIIGAELSTPENVKKNINNNLEESEVKFLENSIDAIEAILNPLRNFILPGGTKSSALLHFARTVCRRAERVIISLDEKEKINPHIIIYLNRFSDLLFVIARFENHAASEPEIEWKTRG